MGMLDDLLSGLGGGAGGLGGGAPQRGAAGGPNAALLALLPVVLSMLASRGAGRAGPGAGPPGGGVGDILGQMMGGGSQGGGLGDVLGQVLGGGGGLGGLLQQLERAGLGDQARSWVSPGQNLPIAPESVGRLFGAGGLAAIARQAGLSEQEASLGLAQLLPEVVDRATPEGRVPEGDQLEATLQGFMRRLGG